MKRYFSGLAGGICFLLISIMHAAAATYYVNAANPAPVSPYTSWATAATNIQDAVNLAGTGDLVLVTNGIYAYGGLAVAGDLVNRVALTNAVTVQSVNGPWVTTIYGAGTASGTAAVRCAWLTNNAALVGFTLQGGATRSAGDASTLEAGGGAWCASTNALLADCVIRSNNAYAYGGAVYQGTLQCSLASSNAVVNGFSGAAVYQSVLINCTIVSNYCYGVYGPMAMTNCIIYYNVLGNNVTVVGSSSAFANCCTTPALRGSENISTPPQLFVDGAHLTNNSPCIGAGLNVTAGPDVFGQTWSNPPSIGCAEWQASPLAGAPTVQLTSSPIGYTVGGVAVSGVSPLTFFWLQNGSPLQDNGHFSGTQTANLSAVGISVTDAGAYQLVVSNSFGMVTSAVAQVTIHCVNINGANPTPPYLTWATAATNIQDAITSSLAGDMVLVTNGVYATGGKSMDGFVTNRVSLDKAILLQSVNGPNATAIQGAWDPTSTNGPAAVRCVWMTNNAVISGFTIRGGATQKSGSQAIYGGGIWGAATVPNTLEISSVAVNCVITANTAYYAGGGAYQVILNTCTVANNTISGGTSSGGGVARCALMNCWVTSNSSGGTGGGAYDCNLNNCAITKNFGGAGGGAVSCSLVNCTLTGNSTSGDGGGAEADSLTNCIVYSNTALGIPSTSNSFSSTFVYSCTAPAASGTGNISTDPLLLGDGIHLSSGSPCIGAGLGSVVSGVDVDGQSWKNPPSMGCDEWQPVPAVILPPTCQLNTPFHGLTFNAIVAGQAPFNFYWSQNGNPIQDDGHHNNSGTANLVINNFGPDDAGLYQVVASNSFGMATSQPVQVVIHVVNAGGTTPITPFSTWATAATNIQDAIAASAPGDIVLVTNGVYQFGGKAESGNLTNRIAIEKAITVMSVNGWGGTAIQGAWDTASTNGPGAVRCAWLAGGANLIGFTLQNGATRGFDGTTGGPLESGGGVWCSSTNATVANCVLSNNSAIFGGGIAYGTLNNSLVTQNIARNNGGGAYSALLNNCTIVNNLMTLAYLQLGAGIYLGTARNCIIVDNYDLSLQGLFEDDYGPTFPSINVPIFLYSCWFLTGTGNLAVDPYFLDMYHLPTNSPCRGAGSAVYATGYDLDGEAWANPPSMGCSEIVESNLVGSLAVTLSAASTNLLVNRNDYFSGTISGRASMAVWSFGDGVISPNGSHTWNHTFTNSGNYSVILTVYNNDNPGGVSATVMVNVLPLTPPSMQSIGMTGSDFQFQFLGQTNANYSIQYSTNLTQPNSWQTIQTINNNQSNVIQFSDPGAIDAARYYRVLVQ